jgi:hypothetical protein
MKFHSCLFVPRWSAILAGTGITMRADRLMPTVALSL